MESPKAHTVYRHNYFVRAFFLVFGALCFAFIFFMIQVNFIDKTYGDPGTAGTITLLLLCLLFAYGGIGCFVTSIFTKLTLSKNSYEYQTLSFTMTASWAESQLSNYLPQVFGRSGLLVPLAPKIKLHKLARYLGTKDFTGGIPVKFFGGLTSGKVKQEIREKAPYLYGFLLTEEEFLTTLDALEQLISSYTNKETHPNLFFMQYHSFYNRYIIHGNETVNDSFNLITRHYKKIAYLTAVWNEIVKPQFPDDETQYQEDAAQLGEIRDRYED